MAKAKTPKTNINKILVNPIRMRLVQYLATHGEATPSQLAEAFPDIPCSSLYRHVGILADAGVIHSVSEEKVRGAIERTFALGSVPTNKISGKERVSQNTYSFIMGLYSEFEKFFDKKGCDPSTEKLFLTSKELHLDDDKYDDFIDELSELFEKYSAEDSGKARKISIISSPVVKD